MKKILLFLCVTLALSACKDTGTGNPEVKIVTDRGTIVVRLYDETPLHRDNFLKLVDDKSYDGVLFHRVINEFMIQSGDPDSKQAESGILLGEGSVGDNIPAEIVAGLFHKKGALAAAREGDDTNPEKKSSGSQFYIVQGVVSTPEELDMRVDRINENRRSAILKRLLEPYSTVLDSLHKVGDTDAVKEIINSLPIDPDSVFEGERLILTPEQVEAYTTIGGSPHLDGQYTVFGEVIKGLDVIDRIAAAKTDPNDRPIKDIRIIRMVRKK